MPAVAFVAVVGSVLVALLLFAHATLKDAMRAKNGSPVVITGQRSSLPNLPRQRDGINILTAAPAPAPDMTSRAVLDAQLKSEAEALPKATPKAHEAQPKSEPKAQAKIPPQARAARAEAIPEKKRVTHTQPPVEYRQNNASSYREFGLSGMN
jgi:hypothetical protein